MSDNDKGHMAYRFKDEKAQKEFERASSFFSSGEKEKAIKVFKKIASKWPDFFPGQLMLGEILLSKKDILSALKHLRKASALNPFDFEARFLLGLAYQKAHRAHNALFQLESAFNILPKSKTAARAVSWAKINLGDFEGGRKIISGLLKEDFLNPYLLLDLGVSYMLGYNYKAGEECFKSAQNLCPRDNVVKEHLKEAKKIIFFYNKLSKKEKNKIKSPEFCANLQKKMRIKSMLGFVKISLVDDDDLQEIFYEFQKDGIKKKDWFLRVRRARRKALNSASRA